MLRSARLLHLGLVALSSVLLLATVAGAQPACTHYASPSGGGNGTSQTSPFRISDFWNVAGPGNVLCLLNGTYTGGGIALGTDPHGNPGNPITVRALNDGGAFLDGQFNDNVIFFNGSSYITVIGIDGGNAPQYNSSLHFTDAHHITVQRVCVWNANRPTFVGGNGSNQHTISAVNSHHLLVEDVCAFGYGRNTFIPFEDGTRDNVFRRLWLRWDGWEDNNGGSCPGPVVQAQYHTYHTNDIYENFIGIFSGALYGGDHPFGFPCPTLPGGWTTRAGVLDNSLGAHWIGYIGYGYPDHNDIIGANNHVGMANRWVPIYFQDVFLDGRYGRSDTVNINLYACDTADPADPENNYSAGHCDLFHADRLTSIINSGQPAGTVQSPTTNYHECTSLGSCPNFYTGTGAGEGSRSCFRYQNGSLTSTPLWPWPMDDRIKQALQRAGIGPTLTGTAGPGYAANTVTSEIVSRYGAIPAACTGGGAPPPPPSDPPIAWWKFEEGVPPTAADSATGAAHPLTISGGLTWQAGRVGTYSLHCDGAGGYGEQVTPFPVDTNQYTFVSWVKGPGAPGTNLDIVVKNGLTSETWGFSWGHPDPGSQQAWWHRDSGGGYWLAKLTTSLVGNVWYHVAFTYDGTNLRGYLNGVLQVTTSVSSALPASGAFRVCRGGVVTTFAGNIDDSKVWNRALTTAQVQAEFRGAGVVSGRHKIMGQ